MDHTDPLHEGVVDPETARALARLTSAPDVTPAPKSPTHAEGASQVARAVPVMVWVDELPPRLPNTPVDWEAVAQFAGNRPGQWLRVDVPRTQASAGIVKNSVAFRPVGAFEGAHRNNELYIRAVIEDPDEPQRAEELPSVAEVSTPAVEQPGTKTVKTARKDPLRAMLWQGRTARGHRTLVNDQWVVLAPIVHGTAWAYAKARCRCDECRDAGYQVNVANYTKPRRRKLLRRDNITIRSWARDNGYSVAPGGLIPIRILVAYHEANPDAPNPLDG